jgi:hypothetical protein
MERVVEIGKAMNLVRSGVFDRLRPRGDGFACNVYLDGSWPDHHRAIGEFVAEFAAEIRQARDAGITITIDIAIGSEDCARAIAYVCISFPPSLLLTLGAAGVQLEVTSYCAGAGESEVG